MSNNSRGQHARRSGGKKRCPARPGSKKGVLTAFFIVAALLFVTFAVVQDSNENYSAGATIGLSTTDLHNELVLFTVDGNGVNEVTDTFDLLPGKIYKFELLGGGHNGLNAKGGISIGWYDATHNASIVTAYYHVGGMGGGSGQGGANGGGSGGPLSSASELGGCGASDIRIGGDTLADRVIIAGGGGGGSSSTTAGGAGGGANGGSGYFISTRHPGGGGTQTGGGNGGGGSVPGSIGSWGIGGAGGGKGGGGGGGYY
ncbi:MAG: glycine-rich protein, partial [Methanomassiliicoccaceae archaeon]|nr:glycine-rich protein [Methanomassiliicoccaceae archaeon]